MLKEALKGPEKVESAQKPAVVKPAALRPALVRNIELLGEIKNKGPFEISPDTTIDRIIGQFGGGAQLNKKIKAIQLGGNAGLCLSSADFGLTLEDAIKKAGFTGKLTQIVVIPEEMSMVELARDSIASAIEGLCGKCIPCREGTKRVQELLDKLLDGNGDEDDFALLENLIDTISYTSLCRLGKASIFTVESSIRFFREEYVSLLIGRSDELKTTFINNSNIKKQAQIA